MIPEAHIAMIQYMFVFRMIMQEDRSHGEAIRMALNYYTNPRKSFTLDGQKNLYVI